LPHQTSHQDSQGQQMNTGAVYNAFQVDQVRGIIKECLLPGLHLCSIPEVIHGLGSGHTLIINLSYSYNYFM